MSENYIHEIYRVCRETESFCTGSNLYILLNTENEDVLKTLANTLRIRLKEEASFMWPFSLTISIGTTETTLEKIGDSFAAAYCMIWERVRRRMGEVIVSNLQILKTKKIPMLTEEVTQKIEKSISAFHVAQLQQILEDEIKIWKDQRLFVYDLVKSMEQVMEICVRECEKYETEENFQKILKETVGQMENSTTLEGLEGICVKFLLWFIGKMYLSEKKMVVGRAVKQIQDYLEEHYTEEANLEKIAEKIELTSAYISTIFKKETGMTITNYLIKIRLEKAKQMIRDTNMTITEIAYAVGYVDTRYSVNCLLKM